MAEDWAGYILQVIKALRSADKANWHHRMVARVGSVWENPSQRGLTRFKAAHIIYHNSSNEAQAAVDAKHEITQQIFTKTMAIQVWKPDNERPGRHFIYTGRYVRFFVRLLYQLNDKSSLEALARRIRKKSGDYVGHLGVWQEVCQAYLKVGSSTGFSFLYSPSANKFSSCATSHTAKCPTATRKMYSQA